jgi:MFS superfamily sulfate permease-like transporter
VDSSYQSNWLASDLVAGITLAAYAVPVSLAYATLAGLPPQVGVYGYLLGGLGYALLGSSRHLAIGPTSAISLLVGASVATMAGGDPVLYAQIATLTGFMVALLCVLAWLLNLSTLTNFISETILLGFKAGAPIFVAPLDCWAYRAAVRVSSNASAMSLFAGAPTWRWWRSVLGSASTCIW